MCDQRRVPAVNMRENLLSSTIGWQILNIYIYTPWVAHVRNMRKEGGSTVWMGGLTSACVLYGM